jgi:catechol 2,3-dioxygenase-like lactoylglutathione lyase family enzyme
MVVSDLAAAIEFFRRAFGAEVVFAPPLIVDEIRRTVGLDGVTCALAQLRFPESGHTLELLEFDAVPEDAPTDRPVRRGQSHQAFTVADVEAVLERLRELGATPVGELTTYPDGRSVYLQIPGGAIVELDEPAEEETAQ